MRIPQVLQRPVIQPKPGRVIEDMTLAIETFTAPLVLSTRRWRGDRAVRSGASEQRMTIKTDGPAQPARDMSAEIVAVAAAGDMAAFEILFREYGPRIRAYLIKVTRDRQVAEDLMQETMLAIWRKAAQFDPSKGPASAWIFTIARNIWIDAWRRQRRPTIDPDDPALVSQPEPDAATRIETRQSQEALHRALKTLPQEQVDLIRLSFFDDASHSTIAARMGLPIGTVKSRIRLAFGRLRTALEDTK
jgi:RNA polymerase sigma factor (sigma-70 family)